MTILIRSVHLFNDYLGKTNSDNSVGMGVDAYMISCKDVREPASGSQREAGTRTYKLRSRFNGRMRWPLHVRCRRKKLTFAISSADEFLSYMWTERRNYRNYSVVSHTMLIFWLIVCLSL